MRGDQIKQLLATEQFAVCPSYMNIFVQTVNADEIAKAETDNTISESHSYEVINGVAVVAIDGATIKKNDWLNAMCGGYVAYDTIGRYLDKAEKDSDVHSVLLHIDSVGGMVSGVDTVQEAIKSFPKKIVTLYENVGASAAIWYGSASHEIYATEATRVGSIGVMAGYRDEKEDKSKITLVSKNAKNKSCSINGDCYEKIQENINQTEDLFYKRVQDNTGLNAQEIREHFNYGETITATMALEIGFLDGISTKKALLKELSIPPSQISEPQKGNGKNKKSSKGESMSKDLQALLDEANSTIEAKTAEIGGLNDKVASLTKSVNEKDAQIKELSETHTKALEDLNKSFSAKTDVMKEAVAKGIELGASKDTILSAMDKDTKDGAELVILREVSSSGAVYGGGEEKKDPKSKDENDGEAMKAYAKSKEGSIR